MSKLGFKYKVGDLLILLKEGLGIHKNQVGNEFKMHIPRPCQQNLIQRDQESAFKKIRAQVILLQVFLDMSPKLTWRTLHQMSAWSLVKNRNSIDNLNFNQQRQSWWGKGEEGSPGFCILFYFKFIYLFIFK